ncbi:hypothetical protein GLOIN_2v1787214 [Rhizophagus clarus]|uniref:Uncharacterized protein n=1 Tax=Rhizophagus clarus TaxID=94130 RepID=A0A8H3QXD0_9GLOM|nr:hypothetical protein GLOIN_2v1787214 [Rhizophagus clarus]
METQSEYIEVTEENEYKNIEVAVSNNTPNHTEKLNEILGFVYEVNIITDICDNGNNEGRVYPHEIEQLWREL